MEIYTNIVEGRIEELQNSGFLYHATPKSALENVLRRGLATDKSYYTLGKREKYLCLTGELNWAIKFCHKVNSSLSGPEIKQIIGIVGINIKELPSGIKKKFFHDPLFPLGIITTRDIPPRYFKELILLDLIGNERSLLEIAKYLEEKYQIPIRPADYLSNKRFKIRT